MKRDSMWWWVGMIGSIITAVSMNLSMFQWIPENVGHWISLAAFVVGIISGKMATSPLPHSED